MNYYIDGIFEQLNLGEQGVKLYSSSYSDKSIIHELIQPDKELVNQVANDSFDDLISFYNANQQSFIAFESKTGINPWFLEQLRLYFKVKNYKLKLAAIQKFLSLHADGKIITADKRLLNYFSSEQLQFKKPRKPKSAFSMKRLIQELFYILKQLRFTEKGQSSVLLMPKVVENTVEADARFGLLCKQYDQVVIRELFDLKKKLPTKTFINKERFNSDQIFLNYLIRFKWVINLQFIRKELKNLTQSISKNDISKLIDFKLIKDIYFSDLKSSYIYFLKYKSFDYYFSRREINGVVISDENSPQQKVIQYAAAKYKIKTFAMQHGAIYELHLAYMFGKYTTKPLLPDVTFTWGEYFSKLLIEKGGYQTNQVRTVGKVKPFKKATLANNLKLKSSKKVMLFASQPQPDENLRKLQMRDVFHAAKSLISTYQLIVRPHPAEKEDNYFLAVAKEINFTDFIIDRKSTLEWHFEISDLLITAYSTVGAEYVPYYKPLFILDYLKQDMVGYIKEGVGIEVKDGAELLELLSNEQQEINIIAYNQFVENYFYKPDGKAAERIKEVIEEMCFVTGK